MKLRTIATLAVLTLLIASGAAMAAPVDTPNDAPDEPNASDQPAPADVDGPPTDLPDAVPDFVAEIHDLIRQFLGGDLDGSLGDAVSNVTPDDSEN